MCSLDKHQVATVMKDVEREGITFSHLEADLIDHICCDIESRMERGISFSKAYALVKEEFGIKGLREIEKDTLMLIDKNYRIMKKSMKAIGTSAVAIMAIGSLFKIMHWPGATMLLLIAFLFTALVFFPALLFIVHKEIGNSKLKPEFLFGGISGITLMTGIFFKIMHWPEADQLFFIGFGLITYVTLPAIAYSIKKRKNPNTRVLITGIVTLMIFLTGVILKVEHWPGATICYLVGSIFLIFYAIPLYYRKVVKNSDKIHLEFIFGIVAFAYFIIINFLLGLSGRNDLLVDIHFQKNSINQTNQFLADKNHNLLLSLEDKTLSNTADKLYNQIEEIKLSVYMEAFHVDKEKATALKNKGIEIKSHLKNTNFLLAENNSYQPLINLKEQLNAYVDLLPDNAKKLINTSGITLETGWVISWEDHYFKDQAPMAILNTLSMWQYKVRLAETLSLPTSIATK